MHKSLPVDWAEISLWPAPWAGKMSGILRCDWLPERSRWSYLARSGLPAESHTKNFPESHTRYPLLTKLVWSSWLDIGLVLFFASSWKYVDRIYLFSQNHPHPFPSGKSTNASFSQPMGVCVEIWSRTTVQMNMSKFIYMSFGERSKDMIGHRKLSCVYNCDLSIISFSTVQIHDLS